MYICQREKARNTAKNWLHFLKEAENFKQGYIQYEDNLKYERYSYQVKENRLEMIWQNEIIQSN